ILNAGDIVAADVRIIEESNFTIDESVLTGESVTVKKTPGKLPGTIKDLYKAQNLCFSGTTVATGRALAVVVATGRDTELGQISNLTIATKRESNFEKNIAKFSKFILYLILGTLVLVFTMNIAIKGVSEIPRLLIFSIALAVSVIPEALPVVITFSLSRGALRLSKRKVIIKRLSSIEDLGSIEVLCTDKTGTLTENSLTVSGYFPAVKKDTILLHGGLATADTGEQNASVHSFDMAIGNALTDKERRLIKTYKKIKETPFDPDRKRSSYIVQDGKELLLVVKGAPDELLKLARSSSQNKLIHQWVITEGKEGKRVVMIAKKTIQSADKYDEHGLSIVGCMSFIDPIKQSTKEAISRAKFLGLKIKILTGDSPEVAGAVAHEIGLIANASDVLTGRELDEMPHAKQQEAILNYDIFARVSPAQKYHIIQMLEHNATVGFLGEGINDAPALKIANVGLVVADATDVAREAADIILLKKDLKVIVDGVHEGRIIFTNTSKYIKATLASNFGNFYTVAITSLFITFLPLLPLQLLLINLLTDFPMVAVAADNVDPEEVTQPKKYDLRDTILAATILGVVSTVFDFMFFILYYHQGASILQSNWFIGSVVTELVFLFSIRTKRNVFEAKRPSSILLFLSLTALVIGVVLPFLPVGHTLFSFTSPTAEQMLLAAVIITAYFISTETVKLLYYKHRPE
ncbi:HAD-IC family P-type ATPase, partial [Candidatus Microgenomates bacterium]|nr:HAD-IC family P-type ATPase [Candidatus Microgenomates bacterium]